MTDDVYHELNFLLGIRKTDKGLSASGVWNKRTPESPGPDERFVEVTLDIPESLWAHPRLKGRMESRLENEFKTWLTELGPAMGQEDIQ